MLWRAAARVRFFEVYIVDYDNNEKTNDQYRLYWHTHIHTFTIELLINCLETGTLELDKTLLLCWWRPFCHL